MVVKFERYVSILEKNIYFVDLRDPLCEGLAIDLGKIMDLNIEKKPVGEFLAIHTSLGYKVYIPIKDLQRIYTVLKEYGYIKPENESGEKDDM